MATKQRIVYGAKTEWSGDGGVSFTKVPEAKGLAVPVIETEYQDATSLDSPNGFREKVPGLKDGGNISIPAGYTSGGYATAFGYLGDKTLVHFKTTMPLEKGQTTADVFEFTGFVSPQLETNDVGDIIAMNINVEVSGEPTFTEGT